MAPPVSTPTLLTPTVLDRSLGAVLGSAAGDALGAPYEFLASLPDSTPVEFKACSTAAKRTGSATAGRWTDDTSMGVAILEALARGDDLRRKDAQGRVVRRWLEWAASIDAYDIGVQTQKVFAELRRTVDVDAASDAELATACRAAARTVHTLRGRSGGNGSLMRTGPLALGYLRDPQGLADAARAVSELTHYDSEAGEACVLWSLAIRTAILRGHGELTPSCLPIPDNSEHSRGPTPDGADQGAGYDTRAALGALPPGSRQRWAARLDAAEKLAPRDQPGNNGYVVVTLQAAWAAVVQGQPGGLRDTLERAVRAGNDTDTVAAIAGSLAGAHFGASAVPPEWRDKLYGWPGMKAADLEEMVRKVLRRAQG